MSAKSDQIAEIMAIIAKQHETVLQLSKRMDIASAETTIKLADTAPAPAPAEPATAAHVEPAPTVPAKQFAAPDGAPGVTSINEDAPEQAAELAKADFADIVKYAIAELAKEESSAIGPHKLAEEYEDDSDDEPEAIASMPASASSPAHRADEEDESANIWAAILGDRYIRALLSHDDVEFARQHSNLIEMAWSHTESSYSLYAMEECSISMLIKYARGMYESAGAAKLQFPMLSNNARVNMAMRGAFTGALMSIL